MSLSFYNLRQQQSELASTRIDEVNDVFGFNLMFNMNQPTTFSNHISVLKY